jgi:hypothetical protein
MRGRGMVGGVLVMHKRVTPAGLVGGLLIFGWPLAMLAVIIAVIAC